VCGTIVDHETFEDVMTARRQQSGFTLIELLVVVSIIAVLAAISVGAFFRVRASQQEKLTGEKVIQIQKVLQQQISAVLDNARTESIPDLVKRYARNDPDAAKAIWAYIHLRKNFPETVTEARSPIMLRDIDSNGNILPSIGLNIPPDRAFLANIPATAATLTPNEQSAVCLYVSLTKIERRGMQTGLNDAMTQQLDGQMVFADTFNIPLSFARFLSTSEMQSAPYTAVTSAMKDPLDPRGRLSTLPAAYQTELMTAIGGGRLFNNTNFLPTVVSAGSNKKFDPAQTGDDIYGYRLNVEGRTGN
jgi:prepilin-type N-terminal cleavage/methylation domain-containing protein